MIQQNSKNNLSINQNNIKDKIDTQENNRIDFLKKKSASLPSCPGIYIMMDKSKKIIYIGKAKSLKNRVSQYFRYSKNHNEKTIQMISNIYDFQYILTDSEFEALVLECSMIKEYSPKYNILLKDDKGYYYIKITKEDFPQISETKQKVEDDATYIGPYMSAWAVKKSIDEILKIFMLPNCNRKFVEYQKKGKPCLNYYIKQCCAPCLGRTSKKEYNESVIQAIDFLKGGNLSSVKHLTEKMHRASENLEFERAAKIRDRISAIKKLWEKQKVVSNRIKDQDVIALAQTKDLVCFEVFRFKNGSLYDKEEFFVNDILDPELARAEFILQYYSNRVSVPKYIIIDGDIEGIESLEQWLSNKYNEDKLNKKNNFNDESKKVSAVQNKVKIIFPKKGESAKLVAMCLNNAWEALYKKAGQSHVENFALQQLQELLGLKKLPLYIEAYDISNLAGTDQVAGMVVFENAKPKKSAYRKFKIKTVEGQDDYESMREVMQRRLKEYEIESKDPEKTEGFARLPDLILLDGGKGHVSAIKTILESSGYDIPVYGMIKDSKHKTRAIAKDGGEIHLKSQRQAFAFVTKIQDEVHRFAIEYHRKKRSKSMLNSRLKEIPGVGNVRANALFKHFKTIDRIKEASIEELECLSEINQACAKTIYDYFHGE